MLVAPPATLVVVRDTGVVVVIELLTVVVKVVRMLKLRYHDPSRAVFQPLVSAVDLRCSA